MEKILNCGIARGGENRGLRRGIFFGRRYIRIVFCIIGEKESLWVVSLEFSRKLDVEEK